MIGFRMVGLALIAGVVIGSSAPLLGQDLEDGVRSIRIIIKNFVLEKGTEELIALERGFPEVLSIAFLGYKPIEIVPRAELWRAMVSELKVLRSEYFDDPLRIFYPDVLGVIKPDYILVGRFSERKGRIRLFLELEEPGGKRRWKVGAFRFSADMILQEVPAIASALVLKIDELGGLAYRDRGLLIGCFSTLSANEDNINKEYTRDLRSFLVSMLPKRLVRKVKAYDDCDKTTSDLAWRDLDKSDDSFLSGELRFEDEGIEWRGVIRFREGDLELPLPRFAGTLDDYLGLKLQIVSELAALLNDMMTDRGDWDPALIEMMQTGTAVSYVDGARDALGADPPKNLLAEALLRKAESAVKTIRDERERSEVQRDVALSFGDLSRMTDHFADAERYYRQAMSLDPVELDAYFSLADLYSGRRRWEQALEVYEQAKKVDPNLEVIYEQIAFIHNIREDTYRERETWQELAKRKPNSIAPYLGLASIARTIGDKRDALKRYKSALKIATEREAEDIRVLMSDVLIEEADDNRLRGDLEAAEQLYTQSLEYHVTVKALSWRGTTYINRNRMDEAIADWERIISEPSLGASTDPERYWAGVQLVEIFIMSERFPAAVDMARNILEDDNTLSELRGLAKYLLVVALAFSGENYDRELIEFDDHLPQSRLRADVEGISWEFGSLQDYVEQSELLDAGKKQILIALTRKAALELQ